MSCARQGHPRPTGHSEYFRQNMVHQEREWQTPPALLLQEAQGQCERAKDTDTGRQAPQARCPICYWERAEERKNEAAEPQ